MTISDLYPITILQDRYGGTYAGGEWIAVAESFDVPGDSAGHLDLVRAGAFGSDREAADFWDRYEEAPWVATGPTPNRALAALLDKQRGVIR